MRPEAAVVTEHERTMKVLVVLEQAIVVLFLEQERREQDAFPFVYHNGRLN